MPSPHTQSSKRLEFLKVFVAPLLWLFLIPALTVGFTSYGLHKLDADAIPEIHKQLDAAVSHGTLSAEGRQQWRSMVAEVPPSSACDLGDPQHEYREMLCERWGTFWQFHQAKQASYAAFALGLLCTLGAAFLALVAYYAPRTQYACFVAGGRALKWLSAVEVVVQGTLAVWLSFWVTALLFERYSIKLIGMVGLVAAMVMLGMLVALFAKPETDDGMEGTPLREEMAPDLWSKIRALAVEVGTAPPSDVIVGVDTSFFVSESPMRVGDTPLNGRTLYMSLPLLRLMSADEAKAVLAHELAHFRAGDTARGAKLGPELARYDAYLAHLSEGLYRPVFSLAQFFRALFELALAKNSREREFEADRVAAEHASADGLARALLKISAFAGFRNKTERSLFEARSKHAAALGIRDRLRAGLASYVETPDYAAQVEATDIPHPFDTHPKKQARFERLGTRVQLSDSAALMRDLPARSWADDISDSEGVELAMWAKFEAAFSEAHEQDLVFRYLPANDEERAHVERSFPRASFVGTDGDETTVDCTSLRVNSNAEPIALTAITSLEVKKSWMTGHKLHFSHGTEAPRAEVIDLKTMPEHATFLATLERYLQRAAIAKARTEMDARAQDEATP